MNTSNSGRQISSSIIEEQAKEKIQGKIGLLIHFLIYVTVNSILFGIDVLVTKDASWIEFPLFFWGVALFIHALNVLFGSLFSNWKASLIQKEVIKKSGTKALN